MSLPWAVVVVGVATVVYTFFGGMRAVVWTDAIQFAVYMLGALGAFRFSYPEYGILPQRAGWQVVQVPPSTGTPSCRSGTVV